MLSRNDSFFSDSMFELKCTLFEVNTSGICIVTIVLAMYPEGAGFLDIATIVVYLLLGLVDISLS